MTDCVKDPACITKGLEIQEPVQRTELRGVKSMSSDILSRGCCSPELKSYLKCLKCQEPMQKLLSALIIHTAMKLYAYKVITHRARGRTQCYSCRNSGRPLNSNQSQSRALFWRAQTVSKKWASNIGSKFLREPNLWIPEAKEPVRFLRIISIDTLNFERGKKRRLKAKHAN